jgi:hypothetical protein
LFFHSFVRKRDTKMLMGSHFDENFHGCEGHASKNQRKATSNTNFKVLDLKGFLRSNSKP